MTDSISIQHVNVMVDDLARADAFYAGLLGLERAPTPELGFPAQFYRVGETQQIHVNELPDVHAQRAHFCLRVDDFDGLFERAREQDLLVHVSPEATARGVQRVCFSRREALRARGQWMTAY